VSNAIIRCVSFDRNDVYGHYYLVFTEDLLTSVCKPPPFQTREVPYEGTVSVRRMLGNPEDRVSAVLGAEDMIGAKLMAELKPQTPPKQSVDLGLTAAYLLTKPLSQSASQKAREGEYQAFLKKLDPYTLTIGADVSSVKSRLGDPQLVEPFDDKHEIHYYGSPHHGLMGSRELMWLSVVYANGKAVRIFSHDFLDQNKIRPLEEKVGKQK